MGLVHRGIAIFFAFFIVVLLPILNLYVIGVWTVFSTMYLLLALFFIWLVLSLRMVVDFKKKPIFLANEPFSVIIPVYNEDPIALQQTVDSVKQAYGNKEIIVINDGSTKPATKQKFDELKNDPDLIVLDCPKNRGKKFVQVDAIDIAKYDYIVSIDSDTIVGLFSLNLLVNPLITDKTIGMTNPNVEVLNENTNLLTKMQQLQTFGAFKIGRRSLGGLGLMNCASGIAIAFRKSDFLSIRDKYLGKRVFGFDCIFGEDRWLTNLILKKGLKVIQIEDATAYTYVPEKLGHYLKQQLRWKISGIIEGIHEITFSWNRPLFFIYSLLNWILPFWCASLLITLTLTHLILFQIPHFGILIISILLASFVRDVLIIIEKPQLVKYIIPYSLLNLFALQWLWIVALFRIDEQTWITR